VCFFIALASVGAKHGSSMWEMSKTQSRWSFELPILFEDFEDLQDLDAVPEGSPGSGFGLLGLRL
jgi:hypothetical protein